MNMKIEQRLICWPRYSKYEIVPAQNGKRYIRPTKDAHPCAFHHVKGKEAMVIDAINVGMLVLGQKSDAVIEKAVLDFVTKYGLLGLMTALPNSPDYMEYEITFLPKNRFIRERYMKTDAFQKIFFPFDSLFLYLTCCFLHLHQSSAISYLLRLLLLIFAISLNFFSLPAR